jgi:hypothetical protein
MKSVILTALLVVCLGSSAMAETVVSLSASTPSSQEVQDNQIVNLAVFKLTMNDDISLTEFSVKCNSASAVNWLALIDRQTNNYLGMAPGSHIDVLQDTAIYEFQGLALNMDIYITRNLAVQASLAANVPYGTKVRVGIYESEYISATNRTTGNPETILLPYSPVLGNTITVVPEPSTILLLAIGAIGFAIWRKVNRKNSEK